MATLSPLLRGPQGAAFLSQSIVRGLLSPLGPQEGASLDSTVSLLVFTIAPPQKRAEVMAEILEATGEVFDVDSLGRDATQESVILSLPNSAATATVTVAPTAAANSSSSSTKVSANTAAVAVSVLRLLQLPIRLASASARAQVLPETFLFDGQRLSALRDLIDIISVQVSVDVAMVIAYYLIPQK